MEERIKDLAVYRLNKAVSNVELSEKIMKEGYFNFALNRAYYAVFDAMRAVNALDGFDSGKHSGVISHFNQFHVKTGHFPAKTSTVIRKASRLRERSDYEDFFETSASEVKEVIKEAKAFIRMVDKYLDKTICYLLIIFAFYRSVK